LYREIPKDLSFWIWWILNLWNSEWNCNVHVNASCYILQHTATHCNWWVMSLYAYEYVVSHTTARCNTLQHTRHCNSEISYVVIWICRVTYYSTLQHTSFLPDAATRCKPLPLTFYFHIVTHTENTLLHTTAQNNILSYSATHCNTLQHTATHCDTLAYTTTHCHTAPHCHTLPHIHTCMPPKKHLRSGFMTPYTPFCFVWTISSELKWISQLYPLDWARVDIRWFSVGGFDTRWIPSSCLCGMSHMLHMNDSCLAYECVVSFMAWHAYHMNKSLEGSLKVQVSFAEYRLFYRALLQKRPIISRILLVIATQYVLDGMSRLSHEQVMSHVWMSHVWHTKDSCLIFGWLVSHRRERKRDRERKKILTKPANLLSQNASCLAWHGPWCTNDSCLTYEWVLTHTYMSHVPHLLESCLTYEWVMSHTWMTHVSPMKAL